MDIARCAVFLVLAGLLAACGNKGPLLYPEAPDTTEGTPAETMPDPEWREDRTRDDWPIDPSGGAPGR